MNGEAPLLLIESTSSSMYNSWFSRRRALLMSRGREMKGEAVWGRLCAFLAVRGRCEPQPRCRSNCCSRVSAGEGTQTLLKLGLSVPARTSSHTLIFFRTDFNWNITRVIHYSSLLETRYFIFKNCHNIYIHVYIIQIWTDPEGNIRLYGPRESNIAQGRRPRAILLSRGPYNLICSRDQSIFVLLYDHWQMEEALITHQTEETFWLNYHYQVSLLIQ